MEFDSERDSTKIAAHAPESKRVADLLKIEQDLRDKDHVKLPWIKSPKADTLFGVIILLNAGFIGVDLELAPDTGFSWEFWIVESVFLLIFLIELCMRVMAECPKPWHFFMTGWQPEWWGIFDFTVTFLGCIDAWVITPILTLSVSSDGGSPLSSFTVLRVFRLLRLARLIRVLRMFNELVILVQTLANSIKAVGWMSLLLGMILYTGSVICVILLGEPNRDNEDITAYFGTLGDALFSHFCVVTLENWPDIAKAAMQQNPLWSLYFVAMITLTNFALVNLMVGVIVERIIHFSLEQEAELSAFVAESEQFCATLKTLWNEADIDRNGAVTREELRSLMEDGRTHDIMTAFGINLDIPPHTLFTIMDLNSDGETTFEDFFNACMRLCGSKQSVHSVFVQHDTCAAKNDILDQLAELAQQIEGSSGNPRTAGGLQAASGAAPLDPKQASPEECIAELLERMDRFGQTQGKICAEIELLKEQARGVSGNGNGSPRLGQGPTLRASSPRDMGSGCVDSLFCRRKEPGDSQLQPRGAKVAVGWNDQSRNQELDSEFAKAKQSGTEGSSQGPWGPSDYREQGPRG